MLMVRRVGGMLDLVGSQCSYREAHHGDFCRMIHHFLQQFKPILLSSSAK